MATLCANLQVEMDSWTGQKDKQTWTDILPKAQEELSV